MLFLLFLLFWCKVTVKGMQLGCKVRCWNYFMKKTSSLKEKVYLCKTNTLE